MNTSRLSSPLCLRIVGILLVGVLMAFGIGASAASGEDIINSKLPIKSAAEVDYPPFSIANENGRADGFSVELLRAALAAMGREVTFRTGPWDEVKTWLVNGQVQVLPLVGRTPEREQLFDFSFPYMSLHGAIVVRMDTTGIHDLEDLRGRAVAVMKGDNAEEFLRRKDNGIEIHTTATFVEALQDLSKGRYDAVVIQRLVALRLIQEAGLKNLKVVDKPVPGFRQDFCFAVHEGDRDTLALLNEGLAIVMADGTYRHLHSKWFAALELPTNRRIVVGGDYNYPPFEFLDKKGHPSGFTVDLTKAIAKEMGLDIDIRLGPWSETVAGLEKGDIDAIQGMFYSSDRDLKFDFSQPYFINHYVSLVRKGAGKPPASVEELAGKRIVVQKGDVIYDYLKKHGLENQVSTVETQGDVIRELSEGKYDCALAVRITSLYFIEKQGIKNLEFGHRPFWVEEYCYAVPQGHKALLAQLSEGLKVLEESGEYRRIYEKWLGMYEEKPTDLISILKYVTIVIVPLLILLLAVLLWSWSLRKQVALRTTELRESEEQYRLLAENTLDVIWTMNLDLEFTYINPSVFEMTGFTPEEWIGTKLPDHCDQANFELMAQIIANEMAKGTDSSGVIFETQMLDKAGNAFPVEIHGKVIFDETGRPNGLQGITRNISERQQAERNLRRSEAMMNAAQRISKIGGWEFDIDKHEMFWTDETYRIHDFNPGDFRQGGQELIEWSIQCYYEEDRSRIRKAFERCVSTGEPYELECRFTTLKGRHLWIRTAGQAIMDGDSIIKVYGNIQDITETRVAEEHLRIQNDFIRTILDNLPIGLAVNSLENGEVTYLNKKFTEIYGWPVEELMNVEAFFQKVYPDPEYRRVLQTRVMKDIESGDPERMQWENIEATGKDGTTRIISAKNIPLFEQNVMISTVQNVTKRYMAEIALQESEKQFRLLVESSPDAIYVQADGRFAYLNQATVRLFEAQSSDELVGTSILDRIHPEYRGKVRDRVQRLHHEKIAAPLNEEVCLKMDGSPVNVEVTSVPINYEGRDGALVFVRDISERMEREKAHRHLQEQFAQAQKMESVGRLAGGVAHDFNNMLSVIIGYSELALDKPDLEKTIRSDISEILKAAKRASEVTRQLLAFARRQTIAPKILDLNEAVEKMLKMLRRLIGEDIDLAWMPGLGLWPVKIDPTQVDQIMANLCVNARDAIEDVGKVTIETKNISIDQAYCDAHAGFIPGEYVMLAVSDDGIGMDSNVLNKIFEPFFTTKGVGKGTGLGMATVYGTVKQNNGFINIYSEPGKGTTIKIYLPREIGQSVKTAGEGESKVPASQGETVLLVEDDNAILNLGRMILERLDYKVLAALTPSQAIELAEKHPGKIDLLITDVVMPEMNGRELAEQLQSRFSDLKVLYMSGYTANVIAHRGVLEEGVFFIPKPFSRQDLAAKVREVLES